MKEAIQQAAAKYGEEKGKTLSYGLYNTTGDRELGFIDGANWAMEQSQQIKPDTKELEEELKHALFNYEIFNPSLVNDIQNIYFPYITPKSNTIDTEELRLKFKKEIILAQTMEAYSQSHDEVFDWFIAKLQPNSKTSE